MKSSEKLTHKEIMDGLTMCYRELISTEVMDRKMPTIINRGKATAAIVTAMHREQIMEQKRLQAEKLLIGSGEKVLKGLKKIS